jgi:hypothetical protein
VAAKHGAQVLWLPPYSPDYLPIEQCWSKIKSYLRGAKAHQAGDESRHPRLVQTLRLLTRTQVTTAIVKCAMQPFKSSPLSLNKMNVNQRSAFIHFPYQVINMVTALYKPQPARP